MNRQIIPFPLPIYLATFFGNKLGTEQCELRDGSFENPFFVNLHSDFGAFVLRKLSPARAPAKKDTAVNFYISVSIRAGNNQPDILQGNRHFLKLDKQAMREIEEKFRTVFRTQLSIFVSGAESERESENSRIRTRAIRTFCHNNHVIYTDKNLTAWKKMCQRNKKSAKPLIYGLL
ncbi:hypothetical protein ACH3O9_11305 [Leeuwenhoekiella sp. A16]|uniref:hypothetical protein n=1 Tax=Leeuwenhoekiella sp. A16 TaxID=3141462 RepID=UPI003A803A23